MLGDYAPVAMLAVVVAALGAYISGVNGGYLSSFNLRSVLMAVAALGFISIGQTIALLIGGIDLSVGPLSGFLVVVSWFYLTAGRSGGAIVLGLALMAGATLGLGLVNGALVRLAKFTAVAATLVTYIAIHGFGYILRPEPDGLISGPVSDFIQTRLGPSRSSSSFWWWRRWDWSGCCAGAVGEGSCERWAPTRMPPTDWGFTPTGWQSAPMWQLP